MCIWHSDHWVTRAHGNIRRNQTNAFEVGAQCAFTTLECYGIAIGLAPISSVLEAEVLLHKLLRYIPPMGFAPMKDYSERLWDALLWLLEYGGMWLQVVGLHHSNWDYETHDFTRNLTCYMATCTGFEPVWFSPWQGDDYCQVVLQAIWWTLGGLNPFFLSASQKCYHYH